VKALEPNSLRLFFGGRSGAEKAGGKGLKSREKGSEGALIKTFIRDEIREKPRLRSGRRHYKINDLGIFVRIAEENGENL